MTIFIGADHRGFELKNKLIDYLHEKNIRIEDMGNYEHDPEDDFPLYAQKVAQAILQNPKEFLGITICGSGIGVSIAANRFKGVHCALGFNKDQVAHGRENDHINCLALPSDSLTFDQAKDLVDAFIEAKPIVNEKYIRRFKQVDE